jgi:hypothetical protein
MPIAYVPDAAMAQTWTGQHVVSIGPPANEFAVDRGEKKAIIQCTLGSFEQWLLEMLQKSFPI